MSRRVFSLRLFCAATFLLLASLALSRAAWHQSVATDPDSGISVEVDSPFEHTLADGYFPLWVSITNASGAARTWNIVCEGAMDAAHKQISTDSLRVENGQTARVPVLMPLNSAPSGYLFRAHTLQIEGYAVGDRPVNLPPVNAATKNKRLEVVVGMSEGLATPIWTSLTKRYEDRGRDLIGTPVDLGLLSGDWRALVGLDTLWLTDADYAALDAARRVAIHDWVSQGGWLYVCAQNADPSLRAGVGLSETGVEAESGLGHVTLLPWDGKPLPLDTVSVAIDKSGALSNDPTVLSAMRWPITQAVGHIPLNAPFLILFIITFAVCVGPLNLFMFARAARRYRLFWTTPAISVAASLLLAVFILLQDGFGGSGQRVMFYRLLPDQKKAVVLQEQVVRTGVLFSRQFKTAEDLVFTPLPLGSGANRSYEQAGRAFSGDWFASRSLQAQRAEAVVPSRAEIQLLNADAARGGAPPVVTSSIPAAIKEILYCDPSGGRWRGENLRTGERITLAHYPINSKDATAPPDGASSPPARPPIGGSNLLETCEEHCINAPGSFVAYADDGPFIDTLPSIRWSKQRAVFSGPVSVAP